MWRSIRNVWYVIAGKDDLGDAIEWTESRRSIQEELEYKRERLRRHPFQRQVSPDTIRRALKRADKKLSDIAASYRRQPPTS